MKTLILNGSPRPKGETAALITLLRENLSGEIIELSAFRGNFSPCIDCRYCRQHPACAIRDDMQIVYDGDYDNAVIASPIHMWGLPSPLLAIASRYQIHYSASRFLGTRIERTPKRGAIILTGGGDGAPDGAIRSSRWLLRQMGASVSYPDSAQAQTATPDMSNNTPAISGIDAIALALTTDKVHAIDDAEAVSNVLKIAAYLNKV